ncbi:MAG: maleylpyruvate isomerase N-terminal domain-containing protein [Actinomycetota bacterium]|nr:maleylpyruvate isomerase N-terminal domain-containing protein [Actinomycetota bacterium]
MAETTKTREAFLAAVHIAVKLLSQPEVAAAWDRMSSLQEFTVAGLAGHLFRCCTGVLGYLDAPTPEGDPIAGPSYYVDALERDLQSPDNVAIRLRGESTAAAGPRALADELGRRIVTLEDRLEAETEDRTLAVYRGLVMRLDDYLETRIVEILVHVDDLALSAGLGTPELPPRSLNIALRHLLAVARMRSGDIAVLRAFARRERDEIEALRVF